MKIDEQIKYAGLDKLLAKFGSHKTDIASDSSPSDGSKGMTQDASSSSLLKTMIGSIGSLEDYYFPPELIGGTCPRIVGGEEEIVWNAAAEACDTERVHVVWQSFENRIWYVAVRSSELASHPNTWCPIAALLPGMKGVSEPPVCYTYFGEEIAVLMIVTTDGLQIFRGTGPVVRAKAERTSRELGQISIINLDQDTIEQLTPVPWYSLSLFEERARRILAALSVVVALSITGFSFVVWLLANMTQLAAKHDLSGVIDRTQSKSMQLVTMAESMRTSPLRDQVEKFLNVNDGLLGMNGYLSVYEIKDGKARWRAQVPPSATADRITAIGGRNIEANDQGVVIGNEAEMVYEQEKRGLR